MLVLTGAEGLSDGLVEAATGGYAYEDDLAGAASAEQIAVLILLVVVASGVAPVLEARIQRAVGDIELNTQPVRLARSERLRCPRGAVVQVLDGGAQELAPGVLQ